MRRSRQSAAKRRGRTVEGITHGKSTGGRILGSKGVMKCKVVISYPSDVNPERTVAHGVCADISRAKRADGVELVPFDWEDGVNHLITGDPTQKLIDGEIADADIFICILWQRFGAPQESLQGMTPTEWEVECALPPSRSSRYACLSSQRYLSMMLRCPLGMLNRSRQVWPTASLLTWRSIADSTGIGMIE